MTGSPLSGSQTSGPRDPVGRPAAGKFASDLPKRFVSALVMVTIAVFVTWWGGLPFAALWAAAGAGFTHEWLGLIAPSDVAISASGEKAVTKPNLAAGLSVLRLIVSSGIGAMPLLVGFEASVTALGVCFGISIAALVVWTLLARNVSSVSLEGSARSAFPMIGIWALSGAFLGALVALVPVYARAVPVIGLTVIAWMFAVVWTTDIAAYFSGRAIGGPKLWPSVSPNKTWAGFIGGTMAGTLMGWFVTLLAAGMGYVLSWSAGGIILASLLASVAGQAGDLAESAIKRHAGVKDSGNLIPGHGGVMDRLDAFVVVCFLVAAALVSGSLFAR